MTRDTQHPLFPTLATANKLFLHFRFVAQNFVAAVASYVYDTAIGSNYDAFLESISHGNQNTNVNSRFSDIFALAEQHSVVLDVILGSCLLRSSQRVVGDLLRGSLDMVLEFASLMVDLKQGVYQEYQADTHLRQLFKKFQSRLITFVRHFPSHAMAVFNLRIS